MSDLQQLLDRNQQFAADYTNDLSLMPRFSTIVLTCVDARIDPAHFLKLDLGDALVIRTAGGRVTNDVMLELGILWNMIKFVQGDNFSGLSLAVIQHTDCGYERLANPQLAAGLAQQMGLSAETISAMAVADHSGTLQTDIDRLRQSPHVSDDWVVSAHLYNVETGLVEEVTPPAPLGA